MSVIYGTKAAEVLRGTSQDDIINGFENDDTLYGNDGNDILIGGTGKDTLDGGAGTDTADYTKSNSSIVADLNTGVVTRIAKIMPIGDSITYGVVNENIINTGGYRTKLWELSKDKGISIDFVGSQSSGPDNLGDKDNEAHPGKTVDWIGGEVQGWLATYAPDAVLLTIGTNDLIFDSASETSEELSDLIDKVSQVLPDTELLIASIPPFNPAGESEERVERVTEYNNSIPGIVNEKAGEGKKVKFVDMRSLTVEDMSGPPEDSGIHPNSAGYSKIGDLWYKALSEIGISQGTFSTDKDTLSNIENIVGTTHNDTLIGNGGANVITGGIGWDILTGNGGLDTFVYRSPREGGDTITDFNPSQDSFNISAAGFGGGLVADVPLSLTASKTGVFVSGANPAPLGTSANFLYNTDTGLLSFDSDGTGSMGAEKLATLKGLPSLHLEQLKIIA